MTVEPGPDVSSPERPPDARGKVATMIIAVIVVVAVLAAAAYVLLSRPGEQPPAEIVLDRIEVLGTPASIDQGQLTVLQARAIDSAGVDQTSNTTFSWRTSTPSLIRIQSPGTQATILGYAPGAASVTLNGSWNGRGKEATATMTVAALAFEVTSSDATPVVGDSVTLTVRVLRGATVATGYRGTVNFTADVPLRVSLPADDPFNATNNGIRTFSGLRFLSHGTAVITARDTLVPIEGSAILRGRAEPQPNFLVEGTDPVGPDIRVRVDASGSQDPDGSVALYNWTWGDTTSSETTTPRTSHVYGAAYVDQTVTIALTATDNEGLAGNVSQSVLLTFQPLPPTASFTVAGPDSLSWYVDVDASASSDLNGNLAYYNWSWGDGSYTNGTNPITRHRYGGVGTYTVNLTAEDLTNLKDWAEASVTVDPRPFSIDYEFYDFFNVPYGEFWDKRAALYFELPVNAECFSQAAVDGGNCTPVDPDVPDVLPYPYMHYYSPGRPGPNPNLIPTIWAPYRMRATGANVSGYTLAEPVILPVSDYGQAPGTHLSFDWYMQYLDSKREYEVGYACGTNFVFGNDGYILDNQITLTMDIQESRRLFGVVGSTPAEAQAWWNANVHPDCLVKMPLENRTNDWFKTVGGTSLTPGKYDIMNGFEWYYDSFGINMSATVDPDGTTHVRIDHYAWGTEALMGRWLYWGNTSYLDAHLNDTRRAGWWGMEQSWFEDFRYVGQVDATTVNFTLETVVTYHLQELCDPGPNGLYDRADDFAFWQWGPYLMDYVNDFTARHPASELDRYGSKTYIHCAPGQGTAVYGQALPYDYTPNTWNLKPGETWRFQLPSGDIVTHDPNLTPVGADPVAGEFVEIRGPLALWNTKPAGYGSWDATRLTWEVYGPSVTGGPEGSPGPDGIPDTADDVYALEPWPQFNFVVEGTAPAPLERAALEGSMDRVATPPAGPGSVEWVAILRAAESEMNPRARSLG